MSPRLHSAFGIAKPSEVIEERPAYHVYATVIPDEKSRSGLSLKVAARTGDSIRFDRLETHAPNYELARREAQLRYPDRRIVVPMLGEQVPT